MYSTRFDDKNLDQKI